MTIVSGDWLTKPTTTTVCAAIADGGHQVFVVGGCVRNALMKLPVSDIDLATDATPTQVISLVEAAGLRAVPTGIEHGTVTVIAAGEAFEVTTFRKDVATDGRRAVVSFAKTIHEDARRRDFTINALYVAPDGTLHDPLNGYDDLKLRRVRFIDDPTARIREDALRILRFFRFSAWYADPEGGLDAEGLAACAALAEELGHLSRERVGHEVMKLLAAADPGISVAAMAISGVLARVLPGATARHLLVLIEMEARAGVPASSLRRLAALGGHNVAKALRLGRGQAKHLDLVTHCLSETVPNAHAAYRYGRDVATDAAFVRAASLETPLDTGAINMIDAASTKVFPIAAADLMPQLEGPALGQKIKELEDRWIASDFRLSKSDLLS